MSKGKFGEPWITDGQAKKWVRGQKNPFEDFGASIQDREGKDIVTGGKQDEQGGAVGFLDPDQVKRAVACVNACDGLDPSAIPEIIRAAKAMLDGYKAANESSDWGYWDSEKDTKYTSLRDALNKLEKP